MKFNEEIGFPHSEICGSKVAHTSPQLIAACHVLHRLCMPRHPPNALTSRLKIRTTNDITAAGHTAIKRSLISVSAHSKGGGEAPTPGSDFVGLYTRRNRPTASFKKPIHNVKELPRCTCTRQTGYLSFWTLIPRCCWLCVQVRRAIGGAYRDRTDDLKLAKLALSQLS